MSATNPAESPPPDRVWTVGWLVAGTVVGAISGAQTEPVVWNWNWPRFWSLFWPLEWWSVRLGLVAIIPAVLMLVAVAWAQFSDERAIARERGQPGRWWVQAGQAILFTAGMVVVFTLVLAFLLAVCGALLAGFIWLTYGIGPIRGGLVGALVVGLFFKPTSTSDARPIRQPEREKTNGEENT